MYASDEIAELALACLLQPGPARMRRIEAQIASASRDARWDDMNKWHRVRLRVLRLQREQDGAALRCG